MSKQSKVIDGFAIFEGRWSVELFETQEAAVARLPGIAKECDIEVSEFDIRPIQAVWTTRVISNEPCLVAVDSPAGQDELAK